MANEIKYVSLSNLDYYDGKIKEHIQSADDTLKANLEGQVEVVAGALDSEITRAKAAEATNAAAAQAAQTDVDNLEQLVGTLPSGAGVTTVVEYVTKRTEGIATDAALGELQSAVDLVEADVATIKGDYLKKSDKDALQTSIDGVAEDVADITADYLKGADKTELEGKINAKAAQTALDAEIERATGAEANLQTQINTIMNNPDAEGAINSINEFTQYVADHGTIADGFRADIDKNKSDIAAEVQRAGAAESALSGRLDDLEAINHNAYIAADTALKNELTTEIGKKADASVVSAMDTAYKAADTALDNRLKSVESAVGESGSVATDIETAKNEAISTAAADAKTKADNALASAKSYTDTEVGKDRTRLDALEADTHTHSNKSLLDTYDQTNANLKDAVTKKHSHDNLTVLEGISASKVSTWDTVTSKATTTALNDEVTRATAKENELQAAIESFQACTTSEIDALFA